ncbi:MAG TPA: glycosyltransferase family 2 protein [Bacteroidales bacterium]|nr:glycosyltransferase family 2 protein [Bacteroidales bacterium]HRZ21975.1 glycosyltransferase family 2 protein [Bacteroidales bacterium]
MHLISVIIPTYNSETTIRRAIGSVIDQTDQDNFTFEILVCDDGSTDNTLHIVEEYMSMGYDIKIIKNEKHTGGPNHGRNNGIRAARGDLIAFLDHDDEWLPEKIHLQLEQIEKGYELIYSSKIDRLG